MALRSRASFWVVLAAAAVFVVPAAAQERKGGTGAGTAAAGAPSRLPEPAVTQHTLRSAGRDLAYTATAGSLPAGENTAQPAGDIFYVAYTRDAADPATRPIAFVFNGGPGAAAAYLHLGAMGPKRIALNDDGTLPPPPGRLVANEASWLPFADLVFVDPPGTGYSRVTPRGKQNGEGDNGKGGEGVFGVRRDMQVLGAFIGLYLSRNGRWSSPKFIVGESYGGFRAAAMPDLLERQHGIAFNGAVMISPVIEFSLQDGDRYRVLPWAMRLPSFAATARRHGKIADAAPQVTNRDAFMTRVERFALGDYLAGLARADGDPPEGFYDNLAYFTGLPRAALEAAGGRVSSSVFAKALLGDSRRVVSLYDGSVTAPDPAPEESHLRGDPTLAPLSSRLTDGLVAYLARELGYKTDRAYRTLNRSVSGQWRWRDGDNGQQGFVGAGDALKGMLARNTRFGMFVAHGMYDLVTPYLASSYAITQMNLPETLRKNVKFAVYEGGHMMYTHAVSRAKLAVDAEAFFRATLAPASPSSDGER